MIITQSGGAPGESGAYQVQTGQSLTEATIERSHAELRTRVGREVQDMEELPGCPACGAPATVQDADGPEGTVSVTCIAHHHLVGPRDLLAPRLRWDVPAQRLPMREELMFAPAATRVDVHRG
jgi:hypothetical protein